MRYVFVVLSMQLLLWAAPIWGKERSVAEQDFFVAYDKFYQAAADFESALKTITPTPGTTYSKESLTDYHDLLEELFTSKPEYRKLSVEAVTNDPKAKAFAKSLGVSKENLGLHKESGVLAGITGLPHRELAIYQKTKGTTGLRKLLLSVKNLQNPQWVAWYLTLTNNGDFSTEKLLFLKNGASHAQADALRDGYGKAAREFNQAREALLEADKAAFRAAKNETEKSRLAITSYIHSYIATRSGKVGWLSENRASYPYADADPKRYAHVAWMADKLGVEFTDLAYIKKREGDYGLKKVLKTLTWINDMESITNEDFNQHNSNSHLPRKLGYLLRKAMH